MVENFSEEGLLECIDKGFDVFGQSVKNVVYFRFSKIYNSERKDILIKPELFTESLQTFFGERAFHVEQVIVATIVDRFHLRNVTYSDSLTRAITEARNQIRELRK
jgi:hypothetical protein